MRRIGATYAQYEMLSILGLNSHLGGEYLVSHSARSMTPRVFFFSVGQQ
jgi:hypothetical protein